MQDIQSTLAQVNQDASQIACAQPADRSRGLPAAASVDELEDQRDELVSQLSNQLGVNVTYNSNGTVNVNSGGEALVSGVNYQKLSLVEQQGRPTRWSGATTRTPTSLSAGRWPGTLDVVNNYIPGYQQGLDQVAQSLMGSVN